MRRNSSDEFLGHAECPRCHSSDNLAIYARKDGSQYGKCFTPGCGFFDPQWSGVKPSMGVKHIKKLLEVDRSRYIEARKIKSETQEKLGYGYGYLGDDVVQVADYYDLKGNLVAQKYRTRDKQFRWIGNTNVPLKLFGQQAWSGGSDRVVITEGEIDALSVSQAFRNNWPVVSIPSATSLKSLKDNLEWLESFKEIVLAFDNDKAGKLATDKAVGYFSPGKVKVTNWAQYKDANEVLLFEGEKAVAKAIFQAEVYRPDEIRGLPTVQELKRKELGPSYEFDYPLLSSRMAGLRKGEVTTIGAGTGVGKSTVTKEIAYSLLKRYPEISVGFVALEESVQKTALSMIALDHDVPAGRLYIDPSILEDQEIEESRDWMLNRVWFYDHFGSLESQNLLSRLRFMATSLGVDFIILDHLSIVVSGIEGGDERRMIDNLTTSLRSLVQQTGVGIIMVSHLRAKDGTPYEKGGEITLNDFRGSRAIVQLSDNVIGLERDQQSPDQNNLSSLRLLKCRLIGELGVMDTLEYVRDTGRLLAIDSSDFEKEDKELFSDFK